MNSRKRNVHSSIVLCRILKKSQNDIHDHDPGHNERIWSWPAPLANLYKLLLSCVIALLHPHPAWQLWHIAKLHHSLKNSVGTMIFGTSWPSACEALGAKDKLAGVISPAPESRIIRTPLSHLVGWWSPRAPFYDVCFLLVYICTLLAASFIPELLRLLLKARHSDPHYQLDWPGGNFDVLEIKRPRVENYSFFLGLL